MLVKIYPHSDELHLNEEGSTQVRLKADSDINDWTCYRLTVHNIKQSTAVKRNRESFQ